MKRLPRYLILTVLLLAALACYLLGQTNGAWGLLVLGVGFETLFWLQLLLGNKSYRRQHRADNKREET